MNAGGVMTDTLCSPGTTVALLLAALTLTGCGESATEYHENEKRDATIRRTELDMFDYEQRIKALEVRVDALEKRL
jgi:hypothetical protein